MQWMHCLSSLSSILLLLIWTIYLIDVQMVLFSLITTVATVEEISLLLRQPVPAWLEAAPATLAPWWKTGLSSLRRCMDYSAHASRATTNACITGMSGSLSYLSSRVRSLIRKCYRLQSVYVMARSPLSTKILSDQYCDL